MTIRDAHDARVDEAVKAIAMLMADQEKYNWKARVEVQEEEPEELEWDPRIVGDKGVEVAGGLNGDVHMNGDTEGDGDGDRSDEGDGEEDGQSSDEEEAVDAMVVGDEAGTPASVSASISASGGIPTPGKV